MKKRYIFVVLIIVFGLLFWALTSAVPTKAPLVVPNDTLEPSQAPAEKTGLITVYSPLPESTINGSSVSIKGKAVGNWFFEASAPVDIVNWDGLIIGQGFVTVDEGYSWMTTDMVPFSGNVSFDTSLLGAYKYGWVIMKKDNPSALPEFDDSLEFKVFFQ